MTIEKACFISLSSNAYSHASLEVASSSLGPIVKKTFYQDFHRARLNVEKQQKFLEIFTQYSKITTPEVLSFKEYGTCSVLEMPYISGLNGGDYAVYAHQKTATILSNALSVFVEYEMHHTEDVLISRDIFLEKAQQVLVHTQEPNIYALIQQMVEQLHRQLPDKFMVPLGHCHGDLTLSNIILNEKSEIYLIDFLTTFLETPLQDIVKLRQDFIYGWSFRYLSVPLRNRADILCSIHYPQVFDQILSKYHKALFTLDVLNLMRIAPYLRDDMTTEWLKKHLMFMIENRFISKQCA